LGTLRNDLRAILADGAASNLMVGIGENYLPAFVLALSGSQLACGMAATVPLVLGGLVQLATPWVLARVRSHRRWAVCCAVIQALSFLPLLAAALTDKLDLTSVFLIIALYWSCGMACNSTWNAWVETLVPWQIRAPYFAQRTRWSQFSLLLGFALGGILLQIGAQNGHRLPVFGLLFLLACGSRLLSAFALETQQEHTALPRPGKHQFLKDFQELAHSGGNSLTILFILLTQGAVYISGPYFTPYMLGNLKFSYLQFMILTALAYLAKVAVMGFWGKVVERHGVQRLLLWGGLAIMPLPAFWGLTDSFAFLAVLQIVSGAAWSAYELAILLLFIENIPFAKKVNVITIYNLANAGAIMGGSLIGGGLLWACGGGSAAYHTVFLASTLARIAALLVLVQAPALAARKLSDLIGKTLSDKVESPTVLLRPSTLRKSPAFSHQRSREKLVEKKAA
jgi:MFS family permease